VEFNQAETGQEAFLMSDLVAIKPTESYRLSLWGRLDPKRPLTLDRGRPIMRVQVEFYAADQGTQLGDTEYRTQMIPGSARRLLFISSKWTEYFAEFKTPEGAEFMKFTFYWDAPVEDEGKASGIIYFDDAVLEGSAGRLVPSADAEVVEVPPVTAPVPVDPAAPPATPAAK
jgi:hypothetical protein